MQRENEKTAVPVQQHQANSQLSLTPILPIHKLATSLSILSIILAVWQNRHLLECSHFYHNWPERMNSRWYLWIGENLDLSNKLQKMAVLTLKNPEPQCECLNKHEFIWIWTNNPVRKKSSQNLWTTIVAFITDVFRFFQRNLESLVLVMRK